MCHGGRTAEDAYARPAAALQLDANDRCARRHRGVAPRLSLSTIGRASSSPAGRGRSTGGSARRTRWHRKPRRTALQRRVDGLPVVETSVWCLGGQVVHRAWGLPRDGPAAVGRRRVEEPDRRNRWPSPWSSGAVGAWRSTATGRSASTLRPSCCSVDDWPARAPATMLRRSSLRGGDGPALVEGAGGRVGARPAGPHGDVVAGGAIFDDGPRSTSPACPTPMPSRLAGPLPMRRGRRARRGLAASRSSLLDRRCSSGPIASATPLMPPSPCCLALTGGATTAVAVAAEPLRHLQRMNGSFVQRRDRTRRRPCSSRWAVTLGPPATPTGRAWFVGVAAKLPIGWPRPR